VTVSDNPRDAQVGDPLPGFRRATGFANWNRYAAVNSEFAPIHMDDEAGRAAGFPTAIGMGGLLWGYLHNLVRDWLGDEGRITRMTCQFRGANTKDMVVTAHGVVTAAGNAPDGRLIELDVWIEDEDGTRLVPGTARVVIPD
jgi:acyl dehydratase